MLRSYVALIFYFMFGNHFCIIMLAAFSVTFGSDKNSSLEVQEVNATDAGAEEDKSQSEEEEEEAVQENGESFYIDTHRQPVQKGIPKIQFDGVEYDDQQELDEKATCEGEFVRCVASSWESHPVCALDTHFHFWQIFTFLFWAKPPWKVKSLCYMEFWNCKYNIYYGFNPYGRDYKLARWLYVGDGGDCEFTNVIEP